MDEGCDRLVWDNAHQLDYTLKIEKGGCLQSLYGGHPWRLLLSRPQSFLEVGSEGWIAGKIMGNNGTLLDRQVSK